MTTSVILFVALIAAMIAFTVFLVIMLLWVITGIIMTIPLWIVAKIADGVAYLIDSLVAGIKRRCGR